VGSKGGKSHVSTLSSVRAKAAAKKAGLVAEAKMMEKIHALEQEQQRLKREQDKLRVAAEIAKAEAEEEAIAEVIAEEKCEPADNGVDHKQSSSSGEVILNYPEHAEYSAESSTQFEELCAQQRQLIDVMQAPKLEIPTFSGDPLNYYLFMRSFEENVERVVSDPAARLSRLLQYCVGSANKVLQCCAIMEPIYGYPKAKALLKERFGDPFIIAQAWVEKVTHGGTIKSTSGQAIQEYADDLRNCFETLTAMHCMMEINSQATLQRLIGRLPTYLQNRWRKVAVNLRRHGGRLASLQDIVKFVEEAAFEVNDPVFGTLASSDKSGEINPRSAKRQPSSFNSSVKEDSPRADSRPRYRDTDSPRADSSRKCPGCQGGHAIYTCDKFKAMKVAERCQLIKRKGLCFNCLGVHLAAHCKSLRRCAKCNKKHNTLIHRDDYTGRDTESQPSVVANQDESPPAQAHNGYVDTTCCAGTMKSMGLPCLPVKVRAVGGNKTITTYALLDNGSTHSFCSDGLLSLLGVEGRKETVILTTLEKEDSSFTSQVTSLEVMGMGRMQPLKLPSVYSKSKLPIHADNIASQEDIDHWPHLTGINIPMCDVPDVMILIGVDCPEALLPLDVIRGRPGEPYAVRTALGWTISGPLTKATAGSASHRISSNFVQASVNDRVLSDQLERFWKIDAWGVVDSDHGDDKGMSVDDKKVVQQWDATTKFDSGHYIMDIPFKDPSAQLANNERVASSRLEYLKRKLNKDQDYKAKYTAGMSEFLEKGYAIKVPADQVGRDDGRVYYLPHHGVINPQKDKLRVVFDCSAQHRGLSLNEQIYQGPDLGNNLIGVLLRFRMEEVAFMADIEAMFMQIKVTEDHQDMLRFVWWPNGDTTCSPEVYRMTRHLFGGIWSPSAANYAVKRVSEDYGSSYSLAANYTVKKNLYVDDCLKCTQTVAEAINLAGELKHLLSSAGFNLTKWICNQHEVMVKIAQTDWSKKIKDLSHDAPLVDRALGVFWNVENDTLGYKIQLKDKPLTKRGLLSTLSSVYDPLGLASPFILKARKVVQDLCRKGLGWDEPLPSEQAQEWDEWVNDLPNMEKVLITRCVKPISFGKCVNIQLHHFADASQIAYGTASYIRMVNDKGDVHTQLIMAKSRLAPLRQMTIPRLELTAATIAAKMDVMLKRELDLPIDQSHFWSDSMIVLQYISSETKRFHTFVANRISLIRDISSPGQWHHVRTHLNPADDASRGLPAGDLNSPRWLFGPDFLREEQTAWPDSDIMSTIEDTDPEVKRDNQRAAAFAINEPQSPLTRIISAVSLWPRLRKTVGWLLVIRDVWAKHWDTVKMLQAEHLLAADNVIFKHVQTEAYNEDMLEIEANGHVKPSSPLVKLQPVLRDGLLRVGGRLKNSPIPEISRSQLILPSKTRITELLIHDMHERSGHSGREYVLSRLREKYWIIGARSAIRRILRDCVQCKKRDQGPSSQQMGDLPADRVTPGDPAFSNSGVDYFGPFFVKRGRGTEKRYGCIFTCLATRAVHIEIAHSLEADSFINCLQRFIARRGKVKSLRSDNGKNFVGAEKELRQEVERWNQKQIQDALNKDNIVWKFNPPLASHAGGVWERQIRTVRKVLAGLTAEQRMTDESLSTLMCLVESVINNRPITTTSLDPGDLEPLTPSHFLVMRPVDSLHGVFDQADLCVRKRWRQVQYMADLFWRRWTKEYLPSLQQRAKWTTPQRNMSCGDIVLLMDTSLPRNEWLMGRVVETYPGQDGRVRSVKVKTKNSQLVRPITKVCLLEAVATNTAGKDISGNAPCVGSEE
jgi:hypothetical protein